MLLIRVFPKWISLNSANSLLPLGRYLLPVTTWNRYQSTGSSGKFFLFYHYIKKCNYCQIRMSLVTMLVLDFVTIH